MNTAYKVVQIRFEYGRQPGEPGVVNVRQTCTLILEGTCLGDPQDLDSRELGLDSARYPTTDYEGEPSVGDCDFEYELYRFDPELVTRWVFVKLLVPFNSNQK